MKANHLSFFALLFFAGFFFACGSPDANDSGESDSETTEEMVDDQADSEEMTSPKTALIIAHEVEDYETWKAAFDEHASARQAANMSDWALLTGRDNPNMVTVIENVGDMEAAQAFIQSEDLQAAMAGAGVKGEPDIRFVNVRVLDPEAGQSSDLRLYVRHKVEDFDTWQEVFASKGDMHTEAGISPVAIARNMEDGNDVTVVLTAADYGALESFINNPELKVAMTEAGVIGEPQLSYMKIQSLEIPQ